MKISKKISWRAAAVAAAVLVSGVASADHRDGGGRDHRGGQHDNRGGRHDSRGDHQRAWRDHGQYNYRYYDRGYRHGRPAARYYDYRPHRRHYGYDSSYYGIAWPAYDYGPSLTFQIPLR